MFNDTSHFLNLPVPYAPNAAEVLIYQKEIDNNSPVCLLGLTPSLRHLCDYMVDLAKIETEKPLIICDWWKMDMKSEVIIGDGVLNLYSVDFVDKMMGLTKKFVTRVFLKKLEKMKYATFFPNDFPNAKKVIHTQNDIAMVVYDNY